MKKTLLTSLFACLAALSLRADLIYYEPFNYADGSTTNVSAGVWAKHSGTATPSDSLIKNKHIEVASSSPGAVPRQDDVNRRFLSPITNAATVVYASFTVNCTNIPSTIGTYFGHFFANSSTFQGRVFAQAPAGILPNTWRLGVSAAANTVNQIFPLDLALNTDYQVVLGWDPVTDKVAKLWVNPISSSDLSLTTGDAVTVGQTVAFAFRQAGSFGNAFFVITNLAVATSFDEAATNVWSTNAVAPIIAYPPKSATNFPGEVVTLSGVAAGQGLLTYQWLKDGAGVTNPNGNTNTLTLSPAGVADSGNYQLVATTPYGLSATSSVAFLWVTNAPIPAIITQQPITNNNVFYHQTVSLQVVAIGPPTLSYQWYYTNAPATGANVSGADTDTLTVTDVFTNNGTTGPYYVVISNPYGNTTSRVATVTAIPPSAATIAFLRTLVDPVNYIATNSSLRWQATGTVTTFTNLTTGDTSSYYLQDSTAGINIFVTHGTAFRPQQGDVLTFVGWLSSFSSTLELEADATDPTTSFTVLSNNVAALPPQQAIPFSITNNLAFCETNLEGRIVMLTNVYFGTNAGAVISTNANTLVIVTNAAGETFTLFFSSQDLDTAGQTLPDFARTVVGVFNQNLGNAVTPRNQGYQVEITRFSDIVTNEITISESLSGTSNTITWAAAPYSYAYRVLAATNVTGPYVPLTSNRHFIDAAGAYTDTNAVSSQKFYRVSTP